MGFLDRPGGVRDRPRTHDHALSGRSEHAEEGDRSTSGGFACRDGRRHPHRARRAGRGKRRRRQDHLGVPDSERLQPCVQLATDLGSAATVCRRHNSKITMTCRGTPSLDVPNGGKVGAAIPTTSPPRLITVKNGSSSGTMPGYAAGSTGSACSGSDEKSSSMGLAGAHGLVKSRVLGQHYGIEVGAYGQVQQRTRTTRSSWESRHRRQLPDHDEHCQLQRVRYHDGPGVTDGNKCTCPTHRERQRFVGIDGV